MKITFTATRHFKGAGFKGLLAALGFIIRRSHNLSLDRTADGWSVSWHEGGLINEDQLMEQIIEQIHAEQINGGQS